MILLPHPTLDNESLTFRVQEQFFLPLLLHGRFLCEFAPGGDVLVRFQEDNPVHPPHFEAYTDSSVLR